MISTEGVASGSKSWATIVPSTTLAAAQANAVIVQVRMALRTTPGRVCSLRWSRFHTTSSTMPALSMRGRAIWFEMFQELGGLETVGGSVPSRVNSALTDRTEHMARKS